MVGNAILITSAIFLAMLFYLMQECRFLVPYRDLIIAKYGQTLLIFGALLFLNIFAAVHLACRKLLLKETGRKLAHLEKQLRSGSGLSEDLTSRLDE